MKWRTLNAINDNCIIITTIIIWCIYIIIINIAAAWKICSPYRATIVFIRALLSVGLSVHIISPHDVQCVCLYVRPGQSDNDYYYCHSRPPRFSRDGRGRVRVHFNNISISIGTFYYNIVDYLYYRCMCITINITILFDTMSDLEPELCRRVVFDRVLGKGTFSTVYRALVEPDNEHIALKIVHLRDIVNDHKTVQDCVNEISNLKVGTTIILCSLI